MVQTRIERHKHRCTHACARKYLPLECGYNAFRGILFKTISSHFTPTPKQYRETNIRGQHHDAE